MVIFDALHDAAATLRPKRINCPPDQEAGWLEAEILMAYALGKERSWLIAHRNHALTPMEAEAFRRCVEMRRRHRPVAYITGEKAFYGRHFRVNRHTLIPRPETELIIDRLKEDPPSDALLWDVGTGCGAIGVTAALEFPTTDVIASDISSAALEIAKENRNMHGIGGRVRFFRGDLLSRKLAQEIAASNRPLIVLANLPYLPQQDKKKLEADVVKYEPLNALFAADHGTRVNKTLLLQIRNTLNVDPERILMEFDPPQANDLKAFAEALFPEASVAIRNDLAGRNRLLDIKFPSVSRKR